MSYHVKNGPHFSLKGCIGMDLLTMMFHHGFCSVGYVYLAGYRGSDPVDTDFKNHLQQQNFVKMLVLAPVDVSACNFDE